MHEDTAYRHRCLAIERGDRRFPAEAQTREQVADCTLNAQGAITYRKRLWLPNWEPLTTAITQRTYDSTLSGHLGAGTTYKLLARGFHWDGMSLMVKRFIWNCYCVGCRKNRQRRQGLLQLIPVADRYWSQISIDFMVNLPARKKGDLQYLIVITDRLSKYIQLEVITSMDTGACAECFKEC